MLNGVNCDRLHSQLGQVAVEMLEWLGNLLEVEAAFQFRCFVMPSLDLSCQRSLLLTLSTGALTDFKSRRYQTTLKGDVAWRHILVRSGT